MGARGGMIAPDETTFAVIQTLLQRPIGLVVVVVVHNESRHGYEEDEGKDATDNEPLRVLVAEVLTPVLSVPCHPALQLRWKTLQQWNVCASVHSTSLTLNTHACIRKALLAALHHRQQVQVYSFIAISARTLQHGVTVLHLQSLQSSIANAHLLQHGTV